MAISQTTRTHLAYQFIILTLLFLGIGYNELLPDRKFIIFLGFGPIFCYQLIILLCCMEFMQVPSWMSFLHIQGNKTSSENCGKDFPFYTSRFPSHLQAKNTNFPETEDRPYIRRWEKSVTNLRTPPKKIDYPQKSKSWMNLSDSKSLDRLSREGSVDSLAAFSDKKRPSKAANNEAKARHRGERAVKAKSWRPGAIDFNISDRKEFTRAKNLSLKETSKQTELPHPSCTEIKQEVSELAKSYSFPFRQKRLETWLEMKETNVSDMTKSPSMPYWQTIGYNLAVKYEARRRRRAMPNPTRTESSSSSEEQSQKFQTSTEIEPESTNADRSNAISKKSAKTASACMNKIKVGFSNLISKKKEEGPESSGPVLNKVGKSPLLFKLKNKNVVGLKEKDKGPPAMPEFPQFPSSNDRPLIFYPKYIPFEKERFENDVKKKMLELAEEQKESLKQVV